MNIAIIKSGVVTNTALFSDLATAQSFLLSGVWLGADAVAELPDGYGIGDSYDGTTWAKREIPEQPIIPPLPTLEEQVLTLQSQNSTQAAKISALTISTQTLEDCLVEMAGVVYA